MSQQFVDSENVIDSIDAAPDKLRAEIGEYYSIGGRLRRLGTAFSVDSFSSGRIKSFTIDPDEINDQLLIPVKKTTITIEGEERFFRDHIQWNDFVSQTIIENRRFLDHTFSMLPPTVTNTFTKNFHNPKYEDNTKVYDSNQLLNYNLISYRWDSKSVKDVGYIRTRFDQQSTDDIEVSTLMEQFPNRIANYTGSATEISTKQRHIFDLDFNSNSKTKDHFPYYYEKQFDRFIFTGNSVFPSSLRFHKKFKNLLQSIKKDLSFSNRSFSIGGRSEVRAKIYNAINLLTSTSLVGITEESDELFLLPESEINNSRISDRFVNQLNAIKFLATTRQFMNIKSRSIENIFNNENCDNFLLCYKVEKFLDNDATNPIQTYYTVDNKIIDTQLKYGRKYIYKTKALVGIFGSSYSYKNLQVAQSEGNLEAPSAEKYWATVDVEVQPSFQILEYEIDVDEVAFIDTPMLTPHTTFYGRKNEPVVNFLFQPRFFSPGEIGSQDPPPVGLLRPSDVQLSELYSLSKDKTLSPDYFIGTYEIYRLEKPPETEEDFKNGFLQTVDESVDVALKTGGTLHDINDVEIDYARFSDKIIPNKKYYYAFRTLTYHGTPSQLSEPLEVELARDSDEFKIMVKEYKYPDTKNYKYSRECKRLMRVVPNIERFLFTTEDNKNTWELDSGNLVSYSGLGKSFKIRVTSKHTGKKLDLNITFKLNKDDTFYQS